MIPNSSTSPISETESEQAVASEPAADQSIDSASDKKPADAKLEEKCQQLQDQLIRLQADFDNFRKRVESEKADLYKYGAERTIKSLLPVLDNLQRGDASLTETSDPKLLYQSFRMLYTQLVDGLSNQGLSKIDAMGKPFDPFYHEAIQREENAALPDNTVTQEHQAGYLLYDRVIRPSMVAVSTTVEAAGDDNPFQG